MLTPVPWTLCCGTLIYPRLWRHSHPRLRTSPCVVLEGNNVEVCCAPRLVAGKAFFRKKKQPVPVDLRGRDWGAQIERACAATYLHPAPGTSVCVRRGLLCRAYPVLDANRCWVRQMLDLKLRTAALVGEHSIFGCGVSSF